MKLLIKFIVLVFTLLPNGSSHVYSTRCDKGQTIIKVVNVTSSCKSDGDFTIICPNLTMAFQHAENNTCILISKLEDNLTEAQSISNIHHFTLTSESGTKINCDQNVGISFIHSQNITITNVRFNSCGTAVQVNDYPVLPYVIVFNAVFYFRDAYNITVEHVIVTQHVGYGIAMVDAGGFVAMSHVTVVGGNIKNESNSSCGLFVLYTKSSATNDGVDTLLLQNSSFRNLTAFRDIETVEKSITPSTTQTITYNVPMATNTPESDYVDLPREKGAAFSVFVFRESHGVVFNITNCEYQENKANWGGSMYIYFSENTNKNIVNIGSTVFLKNKADQSGGGIFFNDQSLLQNSLLISDSLFEQNVASNCGSGVYTFGAMVAFKGRTIFKKNSGSAFVAGGGSILKVHEELLFTNNQAAQGAAIYMYKCSAIELHSTTNLTFLNNTVTKQGGALYIFHRFIKTATKCFFLYGDGTKRETFKGTVTFSGNHANGSGDHIYASTFKLCTDGKNIMAWPNFSFLPPNEMTSLESAVEKITVNETDWSNHNLDDYFHPKVLLTNEFGLSLTSYVSLQTLYNNCKKSTEIVTDPESNCVPCNYTVDANYFVVPGSGVIPDVGTELIDVKYIGAQDSCDFVISASSEMGVVSQEIQHLHVNSCPPFFDNVKGNCVCNHHRTKAQCIENKIYVPPNYWVSNNNNEVFKCPDMYCSPCEKKENIIYVQLCMYQPDKQCTNNRSESSQLCSRCLASLSVGLGSPKCLDCQSKDNLETLTRTICFELITVLIAQLIIMFLNYNYYASFLIPILYFYQLVPFFLTVNEDLYSDLSYFSKVLLAITNSEGGVTSGQCLIHGMDDLTKLWVQFGCGVLWLIVYIIFHLITRHILRRFRNTWIRTGPIVAIVVFLDLITFSCRSVNWVYINNNYYVYVFADELYYSKRHLPLFITAVCSLIAMIVAVAYVVFKVYQRPGLLNIFDINNEDNNGGCRPTKHWIYPSYFLFILVFVSVGVMRSNDDRSLILLMVSLIFLCVYSFLMPYKNISNMFELFVLFNLITIGAIADNLDTTQDHKPTASVAIQWFLLIPFVGLVLWMGYIILKKFRVFRDFCRITDPCKERGRRPLIIPTRVMR